MDSSGETLDLSRVSVVLVRPRYAGNLGQCARAMRNFGLQRLVLVAPECDPAAEETEWFARSEGKPLLDAARRAETLAEALRDFQVVVGTSRRLGKYRRPAVTPEEAARELVPLSRENEIAVVFGSEPSGLSWDDLDLCQRLVSIPADPDFPSFNLAHAVLLVCYELFRATAPVPPDEPPLRATHEKAEALFEHALQTWLRIGYLKRENPWTIMTVWRRMLGRSGLTEREVSVMRGMLHQVDWVADRAGLPPPGEEAPKGTFRKHRDPRADRD